MEPRIGFSVITRYLGPTNSRGARIVVETYSGKRTILPYDHAAQCPHHAAALQIAVARCGKSALGAECVRGHGGERGYSFTWPGLFSAAVVEAGREGRVAP